MTGWTAEGIVVGAKDYGEKSALVYIFTDTHGLSAGILCNGQAGQNRSLIQIGNRVNADWNARLAEHLGMWKLELIQQILSFTVSNQKKLMTLEVSSQLLYQLLPERHPYEALYESFLLFLDSLRRDDFLEEYIRFELAFLKEMGFGLDLSHCAVTSTQEGLTHVSPKTGRSVCAEVAFPYEDRLLKLPPFLKENVATTPQDLKDALILTGYFLHKHFKTAKLEPILEQREKLIDLII